MIIESWMWRDFFISHLAWKINFWVIFFVVISNFCCCWSTKCFCFIWGAVNAMTPCTRKKGLYSDLHRKIFIWVIFWTNTSKCQGNSARIQSVPSWGWLGTECQIHVRRACWHRQATELLHHLMDISETSVKPPHIPLDSQLHSLKFAFKTQFQHDMWHLFAY